MLTIDRLTYRIAGRTLFENASAVIPGGHRVGLVGRNGAGKSTLFSLILQEAQPDNGSIELQRGTRIGIVAQEAPGGAMSPADVVLAADLERAALLNEAETATDPDRIGFIHQRLDEIDAHSAPARAAQILNGLGFTDEMCHRPMSSYSGGWRMRVALAAALFAAPDLLLLDEPTNHLDLEASAWLETYLKNYPHTLLMISHDRQILNSSVDHILHLDRQALTYYTGGYDTFLSLRAAKMAQNKAMAAKQEQQRAHLQSFIDRFKAKATKARQAQSRMKALARLKPISVLEDQASLTFEFPDPPELSPPMISLNGIDLGYEPGKPILRGLNQRIDPDDRIALLGSNGNGKSTFAKLLAGRLDPLKGEIHRAGKLRCGFFAQHQIEDMDGEGTAFTHLAALIPNAREFEIRTRLGRFGFSGDKAFVKVKDLSGGERARLNFALITHDAPPLLIFDEPTNHLDIDSRDALADAINDFKGAVILISHDWHLLELTADRLWLVANGKVEPFDGDLEDYRRAMLSQRAIGERAKQDATGKKPSGKERGASSVKRKQVEPLRKAAKQAEADLLKETKLLKEVEEKLIEAKIPITLRIDLMKRQTDLKKSIEQKEKIWFEAEEALEDALNG